MTDVPTLLAIAASAVAVIGIGLAAVALASLRRRRWSAGALASLSGLVLLLLAVLGWGVVLGTRGYRALTREVVAASITTRSTGPRSFRAVVERPGSRPDTFRIAGDQLYVDAHVLRWQPWVNVLGVHTGYRLTRIGGRYRSLEAERDAERTVYGLSEPPPLDLLERLDRLPVVGRVVDATYGSGSFVPADDGGSYQVRVTTSGLLIRSAPDTAGTADDDGTDGGLW